MSFLALVLGKLSFVVEMMAFDPIMAKFGVEQFALGL